VKKAELVDKIASSAKITKSQANDALNAALETIKKALKKDGKK